MSLSNNGQFGDRKVFVGGLAWETQKETMKNYFDQFGEILEAVVIFDKNTGRSKGYGFVTFKEAEAARRACVDPSPVIDGRRANCNLASLGVQRSRPSTPKLGGGSYLREVKSYQKQGGVGTPIPCTPTIPHYAIQQGIPCALYGYGYGYSPSYSFPTTYYSICGGTSSNPCLVYGTAGNGTISNSNFYPYMQYGFGFPQQQFEYPIIASSSVYPPILPHSQPAGVSVSGDLAAAASAPHYTSQTNSLGPISSI